MRAVRGRDTAPEIKVRRKIHSCGYRFRLHRRDLPGQPDLVLPRFRTVIFVNGCFWHGHTCKRGLSRPATNAEFWNRKIDGNVARDQRNIRLLRELGWSVEVIWQCSLMADLDATLRKLDTADQKHFPY